MPRTFRTSSPDPLYLLPPSLQEWLPEGHLASFILDVVAELDLSALYAAYEGDGRGQPPYDQAMMTALLLYASCVGVPSSRRIEKRTQEDVAFRILAGNQRPDHASICAFRARHLQALGALFVQALRLCAAAALVKLGHVALDGTKIKVNAAKHKAMSYGRMQAQKAALEREVAALLRLPRLLSLSRQHKVVPSSVPPLACMFSNSPDFRSMRSTQVATCCPSATS